MSRKSVRSRITKLMLTQAESDFKNGYTTPYSYWRDVMNLQIPELEELSVKDRQLLIMKASENLTKLVTTASDLEEAETAIMETKAAAEKSMHEIAKWMRDNDISFDDDGLITEHIVTIEE